MKHLLTAAILLSNFSIALGQGNNERTFFQAKSKAHFYYIELSDSKAKVYEMGSYLDKAGSGYSIRKTDTLYRQPGGMYAGKSIRLVTENNKTYLTIQNKKTKKYTFDEVTNLQGAYTNLNNGYYLDHFFAMCDTLNKTYPLNHFSFRNGFYYWKELSNKTQDPLQFRIYANEKLKYIKDSISSLQNQYVSLTTKLNQNIQTIDYNTLKDSLTLLPAEFGSNSWYFGTVVNNVSKYRPEFFFRLAEDLPQKRDVVFAAVEDNKEVIANLKAVENHDEIKKDFFKDRKFGKSMPYKIIGTYAIVGGLIALLIATQ